MKAKPHRLWIVALAAGVIAVGLSIANRAAISDWLLHVTGEEQLLPQVRGLWQLASNVTRPLPDTADDVPTAFAGVNPFGINVFLEQEVELAKRERVLQMVSQAGFGWIRQEFPWEDIEIHGQGDFEDRRHEPHRSAWEKYDHIVALAEKYGLEIVARLSNPPAWSRAAGDENGTRAPPDDLDDYGDYVAAVVGRYKGRVRYYQIWNEPNIHPEWGNLPIDPEGYVELLKVAYSRAKETDPGCVIVSVALAQTIELGDCIGGYNCNLNDFLFLQRLYDAGARDYFDILAVNDYGMWSGPYDRRMRPRVINFSRPMYIRDIMVKNGDAAKPIWFTEMNWNAIPDGHPAYPSYGRVTDEQLARYVVEGYQRAQEEWPWVGVIFYWFFKRPHDLEKDQAWYYFRMAEPDSTPLPVYDAMKAYTARSHR
ncbi:MAG: hypothetical protein JSV36_17990 [Anaerolineae bacterium]|nr:MAG: hypothetical protein JSV36_17990 [Anaerolineae bacterium]